MLTFNKYERPQTLEEAWTLNKKKSARLAAGTMWMRMGSGQTGTLIDLCGLGLDQLEETQDAFCIGAMVPLRRLETWEPFVQYTNGAVKEALRHIIGVQFRNTATVGGSIWGRFGFSDVITLFLALETTVELYCGPGEEKRVMTLDDFVQEAQDQPKGAILTRVIVRKERAAFDYRSVRRTATDFPVLTEAAAKLGDGAWRFAIGARPGIAVRAEMEQGLITEDSTDEIITAMCQNIDTGTNMRGSAAYRTHLMGVLVGRSIRKLMGDQSSTEVTEQTGAEAASHQ
jgi:CO/xanthine dehydrogenase FAD-binding subunit